MKEKWGSHRVPNNVVLRFSWFSLICNHSCLDAKNVTVYVLR
jgi:hypothetical protein